jgi:hypothetical protein
VAAWRYLFWDWSLTRQIDQLPLQSPNMSWEVDAAGTITAQVPLFDRALSSSRVLAATAPLKTRVYCERNGKLVWGGRLIEPRAYDSSTGMLTINGEETVGYFADRFVPTLNLYGQDQIAIAEQVITSMQSVSGGDAKLAVTALNGMSGVLRDGVYSKWDFTPGLQALTDITEMESGFEFASRVSWDAFGVPYDELLLAYPYLGRRRTASPAVIEYNHRGGGNCQSYQWPDGPGLFVRTYTGATTPDGVQLVAWADTTPLLDEGYPLLEQKVDVTSSKPTTQAALQGYANRAAGWASGERVAAQFTMKPNPSLDISTFGLGDDVLVRITDHRFPAGPGGRPGFAGWMRVGQIQCIPDQNGLEQYVVTTLDYTEPV